MQASLSSPKTAAELFLGFLSIIWSIDSYNTSLYTNQLALAANQIALHKELSDEVGWARRIVEEYGYMFGT